MSRAELGADIQPSDSYAYDVSENEEIILILHDPSKFEDARVIVLENWLATVDFD